MISIKKILIVFALCLGVASTAQAKSLLPAPPKSSINLLGKKMIVNGIPMQIRQFSSKKSLQEVVDFYKTLWDEGDEGFPGYSISNQLEPWTIISRIEDNYILTVQVASDSKRRAAGYLSVSPLDPEQISKPGKGVPQMKGSVVLNDTISEDHGKRGRNVLLKNSSSMQSNANFYRQYYNGKGWEEINEIPPLRGKQHVLQFRRANTHVTLVLMPEIGGTLINSQSETEGLF